MDRPRLRVKEVRRGRMLPVDDPAPCDACARLAAENDRLRDLADAVRVWRDAPPFADDVEEQAVVDALDRVDAGAGVGEETDQ